MGASVPNASAPMVSMIRLTQSIIRAFRGGSSPERAPMNTIRSATTLSKKRKKKKKEGARSRQERERDNALRWMASQGKKKPCDKVGGGGGGGRRLSLPLCFQKENPDESTAPPQLFSPVDNIARYDRMPLNRTGDEVCPRLRRNLTRYRLLKKNN